MLTRPPERYRPDPQPDRVRTLLFATIPPDYFADRATWFAAQGVEGVMIGGIMSDWSDDIWALPDGSRIVGTENPRFRQCKRMNERCADAEIRYNSVKVAFYKVLPDWFDGPAWRQVCENFRQCAIFARDSGFAGVAIDIEYIAQMYDLEYEAYQAPGYPRERLRTMARQRGDELMDGMLREFPDMVNWHLPEGIQYYGPLATDLLVGMIGALARHDAPGGVHLCTEGTYTHTEPVWILRHVASLDRAVANACDGPARAYWRRKGTICPGLWPLGYYRDILDASGKRIGYSGRNETFGDKIVGSYADKSENYPAADFRRQYGAARMVAGHSLWIYCHGSVLYQMSEEERTRYQGGGSDVLPVAKDLDAYLAVLRDRPIIADEEFARAANAVRRKEPIDLLAGRGIPPFWWHVGPFPNPEGRGHDVAYPPEQAPVDLGARIDSEGNALPWSKAETDASGFVNLRKLVGREDFVLSYSATWITSPKARTALIRFGSDDSAKLWINGRLVHSVNEVRGPVEDEETIPIDLPSGKTSILVKCGNYRGGWGFYLRLTDEAGHELPDIVWAE